MSGADPIKTLPRRRKNHSFLLKITRARCPSLNRISRERRDVSAGEELHEIQGREDRLLRAHRDHALLRVEVDDVADLLPEVLAEYIEEAPRRRPEEQHDARGALEVGPEKFGDLPQG